LPDSWIKLGLRLNKVFNHRVHGYEMYELDIWHSISDRENENESLLKRKYHWQWKAVCENS
jgi:hypothetical protein